MTDLEKYEAIDKFFDEHIRPALAGDGGGVELELVKGHEVIVSYQGACGTCPSSSGATLDGIQRALRQHVDKDIEVIPTNAFGMQKVESELNNRFGTVHPFGGQTYEEQIAERTKTSPFTKASHKI